MLKDLYTDIVKSTLEQIAPTTDASSQKLLTDINSATDNKQAKRLITEYLEIHHKELEKTKSFASHLVKILIKNDENHKRKWKCYDAYPIKLYTGIAQKLPQKQYSVKVLRPIDYLMVILKTTLAY